MLHANLPPVYFQQNTIAEIREYKPPLERAENDEPVTLIYHLAEVQLPPIVGTASLPDMSFLPVYVVGTGHFSHSSLLPHTG